MPFEISQKEMAVALKWCIFDPMLLKPKCFQRREFFLKHILDLPIWGQICTVSVLQPFPSDFFYTEHPLPNFVK